MCIPCATPNLLLKYPDATVPTYKIRQMKHLKQASKTLAKTPENYCKHMQHLNKTLTNIHMKHLKIFETYVCNMHVYATFRSTFATTR
jgi:hypothetical protein